MHPSLAPLFARRSVRSFTGRPIADDLLTALLEAAMAAPSARAKDPWHFLVIRNQQRLVAVADLLPYGKMLPAAGCGIIVCGDLETAHRGSESYLLQDCSAATENLLLAASMLGLGAVWLGVHPNEDRIAGLRRLCDLSATIIPVAAVAIGHPAETSTPRTRFAADKVHREHW